VIIGGRSGAGRRTSSAGSDCSDLTALTAAPWTAVPAAAGPAVHGPPHHAPVAYVTARPAVHDPSGTHRPARTREYGECRRREDAPIRRASDLMALRSIRPFARSVTGHVSSQ